MTDHGATRAAVRDLVEAVRSRLDGLDSVAMRMLNSDEPAGVVFFSLHEHLKLLHGAVDGPLGAAERVLQNGDADA